MLCTGRAHVTPPTVEEAIAKLRSLHEGDRGIVEVVALGTRTIPHLRRLLFEREPSGLFESRCRAVHALAALRAYSVIADFFELSRDIVDPVERTGEDAVINAAARALAATRGENYVPLLLTVAARHAPLAGIIEALGSFERLDALPYFIDGLAEDFTRKAAENALRTLGRGARAALVHTALDQSEAAGGDAESNVRRRTSALNVLAEMDDLTPDVVQQLRPLVEDSDPRIAILACRLYLDTAPRKAGSRVVRRLLSLLSVANWLQEQEIEECLRRHFELAREQIAKQLRGAGIPAPTDTSPRARTIRALRRVMSCPPS